MCLKMFEALIGHDSIFDGAAIDATHIKALRSTIGARRGLLPRHRPFPRGTNDQAARRRLVEDGGRPRVLRLSTGKVNDISMAETLIRAVSPFCHLLAHNGYHANHLRRLLAERGREGVIPSTASRRASIPYDTLAHKERNKVEQMQSRLKDLRRVVTRYAKLAKN